MTTDLHRLLDWAELNKCKGTAHAVRTMLAATDRPSADLFAPPMPAMPPAQESPGSGQESGFNAANWAWPGDVAETTTYRWVLTEDELKALEKWRQAKMAGWFISDNTEPLLSKAAHREVAPQVFILAEAAYI